MKIIELLQKNQKKIIEGFVVSFVGGWALSALLGGSFAYFNDVRWSGEKNFLFVIATLLLSSAIMGVVYYYGSICARLLMFEFVFGFAMICSYKGSGFEWGEYFNNPIGSTCYSAVLCLVVVLAIFPIALYNKLQKGVKKC